jgi:Fe-S-cluster containining protein
VSIAVSFEATLRDYAIEEKIGFSCTKGCTHCCYYPVTISLLEGSRLYTALVEAGRWTPSMRRKCEELSKRLIALAPQVWLLSMTPCPLLNAEGACMVYDERPLHCRTAFSVDDPDLCHPHRTRDGSGILPKTDPLNELAVVEEVELKRLGAKRILVPIATALVVADKMEADGCDVTRAYEAIMRSYTEALHQ